MSENFGHPVTHVQKLQISLLMLKTDFCPSPLHWGQNLLSELSPECGFFAGVENTDFTQLGFIDNLESKGEGINKNQLNTPLGGQN